MVSNRRWKTAQNAERKAQHSWRGKDSPAKRQFLFQNFQLCSDFFTDKAILEVGCSPASHIHSCGKAYFKTGIDPLAAEFRHLYPTGTNHIQGLGEYLPFKDEAFDIVLCLNTLDHVQNPVATLKEIYRVLKRGGNLLLYLQTFSTLKIIRKWLGLIDRPHPHHFSDSEVSLILQKLGYNVSYHRCRKANLNSAIVLIQKGLIASGLKSLGANLFLGLHNSFYTCSKVM